MRLVFAGGLSEPILIKISKGLTDETGAAELTTDHTFAYPQEPFFSVASVQWGQFEGPKKEIVLQFTKPVAADTLSTGVSVVRADTQSAVPFEVASQGESTEHRIRVDLAGADFPSLSVQLAKGMPGSQGRRLVEDYAAALDTRPEPLKVASVRWGATDGEMHRLFVKFSHPVRNDALTARLTLTEMATSEDLPFEVLGDELSVDKTLEFHPVERDKVGVTLAIEAGLPGAPNAALHEPYRYEVTRPAPPCALKTHGGARTTREPVSLDAPECDSQLRSSKNTLPSHRPWRPFESCRKAATTSGCLGRSARRRPTSFVSRRASSTSAEAGARLRWPGNCRRRPSPRTWDSTMTGNSTSRPGPPRRWRSRRAMSRR